MKPLKIKVCKAASNARYPAYATPGSAGMDLTSVSTVKLNRHVKLINTGLCFEIPEGYVGKLYIRSGLAAKGVSLANGCGIIDSDYVGEVKIPLSVRSPSSGTGSFLDYLYEVKEGERIAQIIFEPIPKVEIVRVLDMEELHKTKRGSGGFGSTD